jgi:hypothetical protein
VAVGEDNSRRSRGLRSGSVKTLTRSGGGWASVAAGMLLRVTIGTSIVLIAIGAILYYAVNADVQGIEIDTVGLILMLVGILGLVISMIYTFALSSRARDRNVDYDDRRPPPRY